MADHRELYIFKCYDTYSAGTFIQKRQLPDNGSWPEYGNDNLLTRKFRIFFSFEMPGENQGQIVTRLAFLP